MKKFLLSHPTGNANVRESLNILDSNGMLDSFFTTIGYSSKSLWFKAVPNFITKHLNRRSYEIDPSYIHSSFFQEFERLLKQRLFPETQHNHNLQIDNLYYGHDRRVAHALKKREINCLYAYEDGAYLSFASAKELGIKCYYELPIAYWKTVHQLLHEEAIRYPEWAGTLLATRDGPIKCARKHAELEMADVVVCPSDFVKRSLPEEIKAKKECKVIPYGAPLPWLTRNPPTRTYNDPIKTLFIGSFSQRKGLADIFEAFKEIPPSMASLTLLGTPIFPLKFYKNKMPNCNFLSSVPHQEVLQIMQTHDLLLLPSIIEGRALVQLEALGCGLPILITPNTGGEDMLNDHQNGFIIPIRSPKAIYEKIKWLFDHQQYLPELRRNARRSAERYSWFHFKQKFQNEICDLI